MTVPVCLLFLSRYFPLPNFAESLPSFAFYGASIFALSGFTIIPEVEEILRHEKNSKKLLYQASAVGTVLAAVTFFLFAYTVIVISGSHLTPDSLTGLLIAAPVLTVVIAIFGLLILFKASLNFLLILRELFYRDLSLPLTVSNFLPFAFPLLTFFLVNISFLAVISLTGDITVFISALFICLIRLKLKPSFSTTFFCLAIILSLGIGLVNALFF